MAGLAEVSRGIRAADFLRTGPALASPPRNASAVGANDGPEPRRNHPVAGQSGSMSARAADVIAVAAG